MAASKFSKQVAAIAEAYDLDYNTQGEVSFKVLRAPTEAENEALVDSAKWNDRMNSLVGMVLPCFGYSGTKGLQLLGPEGNSFYIPPYLLEPAPTTDLERLFSQPIRIASEYRGEVSPSQDQDYLVVGCNRVKESSALLVASIILYKRRGLRLDLRTLLDDKKELEIDLRVPTKYRPEFNLDPQGFTAGEGAAANFRKRVEESMGDYFSKQQMLNLITTLEQGFAADRDNMLTAYNQLLANVQHEKHQRETAVELPPAPVLGPPSEANLPMADASRVDQPGCEPEE